MVNHDRSRDQVYDQANDRASTNPDARDHRFPTQTRLLPGDRVGDDDRNDRDVVTDWENDNLKSPPSGYSWLRHDGSGQYLLTEMQTGRVVDAVDQARARNDRFDNRQSGHHDPRADSGAGNNQMNYVDGQGGGSRPSGDWSRGGRVPEAYRDDNHTVSDWRDRNLRAPAGGYVWIRNDSGQYVLASRHSGRIADVVDQDRYRGDYTWNRGDRLSGGYLDPRFTVTDWQAAGLPRPAPGRHWVRINGHFMLTSRRTGLITDILPANH